MKKSLGPLAEVWLTKPFKLEPGFGRRIFRDASSKYSHIKKITLLTKLFDLKGAVF